MEINSPEVSAVINRAHTIGKQLQGHDQKAIKEIAGPVSTALFDLMECEVIEDGVRKLHEALDAAEAFLNKK